MKAFMLLACFVASVLCQDKYDSSSDNFDVSEVLHNERLLKSYAKCLLDKGPCTPEIKRVKDKLPEALATRCAKCTERQKQMGETLAREVSTRYPDLWRQLVKHYDPTGVHQQAFEDYLKPKHRKD